MLTATISHDMRTPLNAILGMGKNLDRHIANPGARKCHKILMNSASLLLFLLNDLLDLLRMKNGKFTKHDSTANFR